MTALFEKLIAEKSAGPPLALPLALLSFAFLLAIGFQTVQLMRDRSDLADVYAGQEGAVEQTNGLRSLVENFAGDMAALARQGDPQAKQVVESLRRQNIAIRPPPSPATP